MKIPILILITAGVLAWGAVMGLHLAAAEDAPLPWSLKVIVYDSVQGMVFTYGSKEKGPVLYDTKEACNDAIEGDEAVVKIRQKITDIAHKQLGPQVLLRSICLPVIAGEKLD
jgi:hypothetical protein